VSLLPRRPSRLHIFITHEFYPRRGGIATFVEEIADSVRSHLRCREISDTPPSLPAARADSACSVDADAGARTPYVVYPLTRGDEKTSETQEEPEVEVWAQALPCGVVEKDFPFRVRRLPLLGTHDLGCLFALARVLFAERARLREASVYLVEPGPILAFLWLQFFAKIWPRELCLTFHGSEILKLHRNPIWRVLAHRLIARATRVSTLTYYTRDLLFKCFPEAQARFVLSPGALRQSVTAPTIAASGSMATSARASAAARPSPLHARKSERLAGASSSGRESQRRLVVLTVGRLHPRKGQLHTLNALASLPPELQRKIEYWLVGSAAQRGAGKRYEKILRARAEEAATAANEGASTLAPGLVVRFLGDVPDEQLSAVYAQADIFALTSVAHGASVEGFGLVYLEASAHGLPIVAHDIGGVAEAVSDGHTGLLVASDEPDALRDAFARLIKDAELRARLGAAGPAWAQRQTWRDSAAALIGISASSSDSPQSLS